MKRFALPVLMAATLVFSAGCATKKDVSQQVTPLVNKIDELDDRTAQTTRGIHDTDQRAQQGIQQADAHAGAADQKAIAARQQADQAQQLASNTANGVNELSNKVINMDNYKPVTEAAVHFGFNKAVLTKQDKEQLDQLGQQIPNVKGYIVQIEGRTDSVGNADYNYALSQRRASAVTQYLATKWNVPAHKIYVIGLGKDAPVDPNNNAKGRAENRRVDIRLMSNRADQQNASGGAAQSQQQTPPSAASPQR